MSRPCPNCLLCGRAGTLLYQGLTDKFYGAPDQWNFTRCSNPSCRLVWLDPMPTSDDLPLAYQNYCTHSETTSMGSPLSRAVFQLCLRIMRLQGERERSRLVFLDQQPPGKLLEVGCGSGARLARFRNLGWDVQGQDVDPVAAAVARGTYKLPVFVGPLEQAGFAPGTFDAVALNHVIEHVLDPVALLAECHRVLRPGGTLSLITPNAASYLHQRFGQHWRALDPPRHLHLFSPATLPQIAQRAGFAKPHCWSSAANAFSVALGCRQLQRGQPARAPALWLQLACPAHTHQ